MIRVGDCCKYRAGVLVWRSARWIVRDQTVVDREADISTRRQFAAQGAQVFVNISNDGWYGDSGAYAQHINQTRMRAIENDRWLLSATDTGVTASIDPFGRIAARVPRKQRTVLVAPYALISSTTFYTRHGDWFPWVCAIISLVLIYARFNLRVGVMR